MADMGLRRYRLRSALLNRGLLEGFTVDGDALRSDGKSLQPASIILPGLDSAELDCPWGRISLSGRLGLESVLTVRAFASDQNMVRRGNDVVLIDDILMDPDISRKEKERLFMLAGGAEYSGKQDILLEGQDGRWLWLWLEVTGNTPSLLENMRVYVPGDNFFGTFPQVYQSDNEFFRRYLSISS